MISFLTGTVLPGLGIGALSGLASTGVQNLIGNGCILRREVVCVRLKLMEKGCTKDQQAVKDLFNVLETARLTDKKKENSVNFVNHGGVAVIARQGFSIAKIDLKTKIITFEYLAVRVTSKGASSIVIVVYRPGSARPDTNFFSEFSKFLGAVGAFSTSVTIAGDINIRLDRPEDGNTVTLLDLLSSYD